MHELSLATEIYRLCRSRIPEGRAARLERAKVAVGELSAVEPDLLRFAWEAVTADGPDSGTILEIEWHAATQVCDGCGEVPTRTPGSWLSLCPLCAQPMRIQGGQELDVIEFSYVHAPRAVEGSA